jgi:hypothetical protein
MEWERLMAGEWAIADEIGELAGLAHSCFGWDKFEVVIAGGQ